LLVGSELQGKQTGIMLEKIEDLLLKEKPDLVIIYGDTNTTLAGALATTKLHIPLAHLEAGCRSFNKRMPEEVNRIVADHSSNHLFPADQESVENLAREGIVGENVFFVGNLVFDAVLRNIKFAESSIIMEEIEVEKNKYVLVTIHRQQSTDNREVLENIINSLASLVSNIDVVLPIHPRTKKALENYNLKLDPKIKVIKSQPYLPFLKLLANCRFCITDSGGIQDEALVFNIPALIPRHETEWARLVKAGKNFLVGNTKESILAKAEELVKDDEELARIKAIEYPYETEVAERIVNVIKDKIKGGKVE